VFLAGGVPDPAARVLEFCGADGFAVRGFSFLQIPPGTDRTMELWNDFEGKTVDGRFHLDQLIGPKGRSAYFMTRDEAGAPATIRLIESLNDEEEILGRWRRVTGLKEEHLLEVLACGQTVLDGTHLVYAVMEPTDMELSEVLRERALTTEETKQIALSVADGLEALHAKGLVHEHVEAENVLAQGETIKLRSDVVREAPEGAEGAALRSKDVRGLSLLLSECLTRSRRFGETRLPVPFEEVVRKGESGAWGLSSITAALQPGGPGRAATRPVVYESSAGAPKAETRGGAERAGEPGGRAGSRGDGVGPLPAAASPVLAAGVAAPVAVQGMETPVRPVAGVTPAGPLGVAAVPAAGAASTAPATVASRLASQAVGGGDGVGAHLRTPRADDRIVMEPAEEPKRRGLLVAVGLGVLLLVLLGVHFFRAGRAGQTGSVVQDAPSAVTEPQQSSANRPPAHDAASAPVEQPAAAAAAADTARESVGARGRVATAAPSDSAQWRVVAFTYNREAQATQKVQAIAARHPGLKPEVFSPSGRAPYLVTVGGWMSADRAASMRAKARAQGLPRDVYAQNYRGR